jgi:hypothetical protein
MNLIFSIKQCGVPIGGVLSGALVPALALRSAGRRASRPARCSRSA